MDYVLTTLSGLTDIEASDAILKEVSNIDIPAHTTTEGRVVHGKKIMKGFTQTIIENAMPKEIRARITD